MNSTENSAHSDRCNGYVLLSIDGTHFVPEFTRIKDDALAYCRAYMTFARRLDERMIMQPLTRLDGTLHR